MGEKSEEGKPVSFGCSFEASPDQEWGRQVHTAHRRQAFGRHVLMLATSEQSMAEAHDSDGLLQAVSEALGALVRGSEGSLGDLGGKRAEGCPSMKDRDGVTSRESRGRRDQGANCWVSGTGSTSILCATPHSFLS